jgi:hypothetical protein
MHKSIPMKIHSQVAVDTAVVTADKSVRSCAGTDFAVG